MREVLSATFVHIRSGLWHCFPLELSTESCFAVVMPANAFAADSPVERYERLAVDLVLAYEAGDTGALQRFNAHYGRTFDWEDVRASVWQAVYKVRQAKGRPGCFALADAQQFLANEAGFGNWPALLHAAATGARPPGEAYPFDAADQSIAPRRALTANDWDRLIDVMKERRIAAFKAGGQITDAALRRIAELEHVTRLELGGSRQITDDGLQHLARMPQLRHLDLSHYPGGRITDRGLEVLRHLPELRHFQMCWQAGISDAGLAHLGACEHLEKVNLLGTPSGDGVIRALAGKRHLRHFRTGRLVTDAGLPLLHQFPVFKAWQGGEVKCALMSPDGEPNHLLLDGPFTDAGLAHLGGLDGLFGLSFFWHISAMTPAALQALANLPNLGFLGCEGKLCNDEAMRYIAAIPRLRMLMAQGTIAGDDGFEALSRSLTLEYLWGRECPNLGGRGFVALSGMPSLRGLAVSCKNVDDDSLAALPRFPALRELMPMDVSDAGFQQVGACDKLERLWCMYCRETTDAATEQLRGLKRLTTYYAGLTQITDRSLELLSGLATLEEIEFYECKKITDAGLAFLTRLPQLRKLALQGCSEVTLPGTKVFPERVQVNYSL